MKALTIKQPWASLIIHGYGGVLKDIENRTWPLPKGMIGQRVAIHSSARLERDQVEEAEDTLDYALMARQVSKFGNVQGAVVDWLTGNKAIDTQIDAKALPLGRILGTVELGGCVTESHSPWFCGPYGFVLRDPTALPEPIKIRGALGFWEWTPAPEGPQ